MSADALLATLPAMDVGARAERLRPLFADAGIDALLVTYLPNVRYLTGFTGSAGTALVTADTLVFTTDGRYRTQSGEQLAAAGVDAEIVIGATVAEQRAAIAAALDPAARVGLEAATVSWAQQRELTHALAGHELVPTEGLVEALRCVKEPGEIARIRATCAVASDSLAALLPRLAERRPSRSSRSSSRSRCVAAARAATASTRSSRRGPTARCRTPVPRRGASSAASSSSSTSGASSTATAPT